MIHLKEVTPDNWRVGLTVREDQKEYKRIFKQGKCQELRWEHISVM